MLSSAVLSYRLGTNSREGKKKKLVWINKWLHFSPPLVCGKLIIYLQTYSHSLLHFLRTSTCPHGTVMAIYRHTRACSLIYVCAGCWWPRSHGGGRGMEGGVTRKRSEPRAVVGEGVGPILHIRGRGADRAFLRWQGGIQSAIAPVTTGAPQNLTLAPETAWSVNCKGSNQEPRGRRRPFVGEQRPHDPELCRRCTICNIRGWEVRAISLPVYLKMVHLLGQPF